jgi:prolyl oligopeptidase
VGSTKGAEDPPARIRASARLPLPGAIRSRVVRPVACSALALALASALAACRAGVPAAPPPEPSGTGEAPAPPGPPAARLEPMREVLHGIEIVDPYAWMEAPSQELDAWLDGQDAHARAVFAAAPERAAFAEELARVGRAVERVRVVGVATRADGTPRIFQLRLAPGDDVERVWVRDGWDGADRLLVDPSARDRGGIHHAVAYAFPDPAGRHLAYGIAARGSEDAVLEILDVDRGEPLPERYDRAAQPAVAWLPDGDALVYYRTPPRPPGAPADPISDGENWLHRLGTDPGRDEVVLGGSRPQDRLDRTQIPFLRMSPASRWAIAFVLPGVGVEFGVLVGERATLGTARHRWRRAAWFGDGVLDGVLHGDAIYVLRGVDAPRHEVLRIDARRGTLATARRFVAEGPEVIDELYAARDGLYLRLLEGGRTLLRRVSWDGRRRVDVPLPYPGTVRHVVADSTRDGVVFALESWTRRPAWFRYDEREGVVPLALAPVGEDPPGLVEERLEAISADGTPIPLSVMRRAGDPDPEAPALVGAYGAYGLPMLPVFMPYRIAWIARGGVAAFCHVRGGGEGGAAWHEAGRKLNKERGVEDLVACARRLVEAGRADPSRLTAIGTSAGGMVVGGAITAYPDVFAAALLRNAICNAVRFEIWPGGAHNTVEFGARDAPDEARALLASDPYHRVRDGVAYPAVALVVGVHDPRVPPWQAAKCTARLQAASRGGPVVLRVEREAGHGHGSKRSQQEDEWADLLGFALAHGVR